jgi:GTP-binding protein
LKVPPGTVVKDADTREILGDLVRERQRLLIARGGPGGKGNARFVTSTRQAPRFSTPPGEGEERWLSLELKLLADVGLIGFPNAGKSTLLTRLSAARPKTAPYPFTTVTPHLGVLESPDEEQVVLADIPGLIEGAHKGVGLGLRFLRHIERTRLFLHLLDLDSSHGREPVEDYRILNEELGHYDRRLLERPSLVALNKIDLPGARERADTVKQTLEANGIAVFAVSALTGEGLRELARTLLNKLQEIRMASGDPDTNNRSGWVSPSLA